MDLGLVGVRLLHFAATMTLFGASLFGPVVAPWRRRFGPPLAGLALASALAWLAFVSRDMAGDFAAFGDVLTGTAFGRVWLLRLALLGPLVAATLWPDRRECAPATLAGLCVASLGLVGHAAMQAGALGLAHRLNQAVHLLAIAAWIGGLPAFLVCLRLYARAGRRDALAAMRRYSRIGHFAVAAVFVSGALNVAMTTHALPWPPITPYRFGLDVKMLLFAIMVVLALLNRYAFAPRISRHAGAAPALAAGALVEIALALSALALVSAFATLDPR